jgi:ATP-dependent Clp protease ATP-binding subunit ClpB
MLQFEQIRKRLKANNVSINISDAAVNWMASVGYDPQHGARPIKRLLQRYVLNYLSKEILSGKMEGRSKVLIDIENDEPVFRYE